MKEENLEGGSIVKKDLSVVELFDKIRGTRSWMRWQGSGLRMFRLSPTAVILEFRPALERERLEIPRFKKEMISIFGVEVVVTPMSDIFEGVTTVIITPSI